MTQAEKHTLPRRVTWAERWSRPAQPDRFVRPRARSGQRLARLGLVLRPAEPEVRPITAARRCGAHHLPGNLVISGVALSHSQRLCQSTGPSALRPWEIRPPSEGYRLEERERNPLGVRIAAIAPDGYTTELVGLVVDGEHVWLQTGKGDAPPLDIIVPRIERDYPSALGMDPRTRTWAPSIG